MITKPVGLYVHIPFCLRKCNYCDFCSFKLDDISWQESYIDALCKEIESYKAEKIPVDSIFFGGGTPSLLTCDQFEKIVGKIREVFHALSDIEFTVEANPKTLTKEKIQCYMSHGVNRISMGLQSIHENEMKILGRIHNYDDFLDSYKLVRECGINNINIDLMYGIPEQTVESFALTLDKVISLAPEHISLYGLIIEGNTPFGRNVNRLNLPGEDRECDMYDYACHKMASAGYNHYEISNYARKNRMCEHNLKYWHNDEYIGVGVAAHSYFNGKRYGNSDDIHSYLSGNANDPESCEYMSDDEPYDYVMLNLRLAEGFSLSDYHNRFGHSFLSDKEEVIRSFIDLGYIKITDDRIALTEKGFYVSNSILTELI